MAIQCVMFDLGGVLLDFDPAIACRALAREGGAQWPEVADFINRTGLKRRHDIGEIESRQVFDVLRERFSLAIEYGLFCRIWAEIFKPKNDVIEILYGLAALRPLYLLSNTDPIHFEYIEKTFDFLEVFQSRVLSYEVGFRKPDREIYMKALEMLPGDPDGCLFIDDLEENVQAARKVGIRAQRFTDSQALRETLREHGLELSA